MLRAMVVRARAAQVHPAALDAVPTEETGTMMNGRGLHFARRLPPGSEAARGMVLPEAAGAMVLREAEERSFRRVFPSRQ